MNKSPRENHSEGDPDSANRFNDAERKFVESPRGKLKLEAGTSVRADEEAELAAAELHGKDRAIGLVATSTATRIAQKQEVRMHAPCESRP